MNETLEKQCHQIAARARRATYRLGRTSPPAFDAALRGAARLVLDSAELLRQANTTDLEAARSASLSAAMIDRLTLTPERIRGIADSLEEVAALKCPLGEVIRGTVLPNGIRLNKVRTPIGVILIIFESRPNVTTEAGSLCLKTGNAVILRGGSEAFHTNTALWKILCRGLEEAGVTSDAIQLVPTTDREAVGRLLAEGDLIDLVIPRGGKGLIERVVREATMPVIKHYEGICHVYVHSSADLEMAERIILNSKVQRPGVCNAMETLLVDSSVAGEFLVRIARSLIQKGVELRGDESSRRIVPEMKPADDRDWVTEYHDMILSVKVVDGPDQAIDHINTYGSHHTDAIVTADLAASEIFVRQVDSACVFVNCSTRFSDGRQFGMGAEIGISTNKVHARGPMGLEDLTIYKYVAYGQGQIRT